MSCSVNGKLTGLRGFAAARWKRIGRESKEERGRDMG
jgi:hypothetical protein